MRITFDEIAVKATVKFRDPATGRPRQVTKKFFQTRNPFNKGADGQPKSREQIRTEVTREAQLWKLRTENDIRDGKFPS
jgi:predicted HNH restriction endonuclease